MKTLFFAALSVSLIAATGLWADEHRHSGASNHEQHEPHAASSHRESHPSTHESHGMRSEPHRGTEHRDIHRGGTAHRTVHREVHRTVHREVHRNVEVHRHVTVRRKVEIRGGARLAHFHRSFRAPRRFHIRAWLPPRGFRYRRFYVGERIPAILLAADFFILDYAAYGLDYPGSEYVWVRDGDDAVLVDRYTGEVIEVEYDVFY